MAFRLRPLHEDTLQFAGLSNTQILILALEASQKLEWNIEELTLEGVRFDVPMSIKSHGEEITVSIQEGSDGEISVRSQSIAMQLVDYGKNRKNIQSLQKAMEEIKSTLSPEELEQKAKKLEDDFNRPLTEEEEAYLKEIEKKSSFISFFIPRKGFIATPILMDLNLLIFILMVAFGVGILEPSTLALLNWGADFMDPETWADPFDHKNSYNFFCNETLEQDGINQYTKTEETAALIDQCGLQGYRHGGAAVSEKHCGFVVNLGGATCADVLALIEKVRKTVYDAHGVMLEPEVKIIR